MDIFTGFILLMFVSGADSPMEFTPKNSMVDCLTSKRKIMRNYTGGGPRWVCQEGKIQLQDINGKLHPINLLELN